MKNFKLGLKVVWKMLFVILFDIIIGIIIQITSIGIGFQCNIGIDFQLYKI